MLCCQQQPAGLHDTADLAQSHAAAGLQQQGIRHPQRCLAILERVVMYSKRTFPLANPPDERLISGTISACITHGRFSRRCYACPACQSMGLMTRKARCDLQVALLVACPSMIFWRPEHTEKYASSVK